jgi:hypothetical protein
MAFFPGTGAIIFIVRFAATVSQALLSLVSLAMAPGVLGHTQRIGGQFQFFFTTVFVVTNPLVLVSMIMLFILEVLFPGIANYPHLS